VWAICGPSPPARRIASFAYNNAAWLVLNHRPSGESQLVQAEDWLWRAVDLYPNKIAYANLADIARRRGQLELALELLCVAVRLDPMYVNGWQERAYVEIELAAACAADGDSTGCNQHLAEARVHAKQAEELIDDPALAQELRENFTRSLTASGMAGR